MKFILSLVVVAIVVYVGLSFTDSDTNSDDIQTSPINRSTEEAEVMQETPTKVSDKNALDLSGQSLSKVPGDTFSKINLEILDISNNNLDGALQAEVRHLQNLRMLDMSDNNFTGVPAEIGQLSRLEILDLSNNPITGLPYELANLKNLKKLDLRGTQYSGHDLSIIKQGLPESLEILTDQ